MTYDFRHFVKMSKNKDIVGSVTFLIKEYKVRARPDKIRIVPEEVAALWTKLSFPMLSEQSVKD